MHDTAMLTGQAFFRVYGDRFGPGRKILDVGSRDVNGTLRPVAGSGAEYVGVDLEAGPGVDLVLEDPNRLPYPDASFDLVISTSCLEHDPLFWLTFDEMARVTRPGGFLYISAPVQGPVHRHPVDCWRFYPDAGLALAAWAVRCGHPLILVESFHLPPRNDVWIDFVAVFERGGTVVERRLGDLFPEAGERRLEGAPELRETMLGASTGEGRAIPWQFAEGPSAPGEAAAELGEARWPSVEDIPTQAAIVGAVEGIEPSRVHGWALSTEDRGDKLLVEVFVRGRLRGSTWASLAHLHARNGEAEHAFLVRFLRPLSDAELRQVEVYAISISGERALLGRRMPAAYAPRPAATGAAAAAASGRREAVEFAS